MPKFIPYMILGGVLGFIFITLPLVFLTTLFFHSPTASFLLGLVEGSGGTCMGMWFGGRFGLWKQFPEYEKNPLRHPFSM